MNDIQIIKNSILDEITYHKKIINGPDVYICKRKGYNQKIGMFGTKYGSLTNDFISIENGERIIVPDGIAHFLEHKLFEQEGANALDLFSKEGISSNAYTTFDHTVYYFKTIDKFDKGLEMLIKLIKTPYFTDENVNKEKGIIAQEINMYQNEPEYMSYFNCIKNMYVNNPVRVDIAGSCESIDKITKDMLYTCYNTFYNNNNMFIVICGDVDVEKTINIIESNLKLYSNKLINNIKKNVKEEPENILNKNSTLSMNVFMPKITVGYKMNVVNKNEIIKRQIISEIINDMYFSKSSDFFEEQYNKGNISDEIFFEYEGSNEFSHTLINIASNKPDVIVDELKKYINEIKAKEIDKNLFENVKNKHIGNNIISSEEINYSYRRIIDSILYNNDLYYDVNILNKITIEDVKEYFDLLIEDKKVISVIN